MVITGFQGAALFGHFNHVQGHPVLDAAAGI
jgi:hypothetical protein